MSLFMLFIVIYFSSFVSRERTRRNSSNERLADSFLAIVMPLTLFKSLRGAVVSPLAIFNQSIDISNGEIR